MSSKEADVEINAGAEAGAGARLIDLPAWAIYPVVMLMVLL
jgi:hypothetical protein